MSSMPIPVDQPILHPTLTFIQEMVTTWPDDEPIGTCRDQFNCVLAIAYARLNPDFVFQVRPSTYGNGRVEYRNPATGQEGIVPLDERLNLLANTYDRLQYHAMSAELCPSKADVLAILAQPAFSYWLAAELSIVVRLDPAVGE